MKIPKHTEQLQPYKSGKPIGELMREKGLARIVKLASNENPLGPSPKAVEALRTATDDLHRYTDPRSPNLVGKLSAKLGIEPGRIIFGHGTDSLLAYMINAFTNEGDEVLTSEGTFIGLYVNVNKLGRKVRRVPMRDYAYDLDRLVSAVTPETKIVYLANPNNPTGTMFSEVEFTAFMERVPHDVLVILDEAYFAYGMEHDGYPDGLQHDLPNLLVSRTLSKVYGLAGLRIGFAVGPEKLIEALYKVKLPFEPNALAQAAAMAALDDEEFLQATLRQNRRSMAKLRTAFDRLGLRHVPSVANFYLLLLDSEKSALKFYEECLDRGLIVRPVKPFGVPNGLRINSGTDEETDFAIDVLEEVCDLLSHAVPSSTRK